MSMVAQSSGVSFCLSRIVLLFESVHIVLEALYERSCSCTESRFMII